MPIFFGLVLCTSLLPAGKISGRVWADENKDRIQQVQEYGLSGLEVQLFRGGKVVQRTTTNSKGEYAFDVLTGVYQVRVIPPQDKYFTTCLDGMWPKLLLIGPHRQLERIDFGLKAAVVSPDLDVPFRRGDTFPDQP